MKRHSSGAPASMVHRWARPPLSCHACREKKRRCDRKRPCANCTIRNVSCEYPERAGMSDEQNGGRQSQEEEGRQQSQNQIQNQSQSQPLQIQQQTRQGSSNVSPDPSGLMQGKATDLTDGGASRVSSSSLNPDEVLYRLRRLEDAVFKESGALSLGTSPAAPGQAPPTFAPLISFHHTHPVTDPSDIKSVSDYASRLPPLEQARELLNHFGTTIHRSIQILHIPLVRELVEQTYQDIQTAGKEPDLDNVLLTLTVFAGAAVAWTPELLEKLGVSSPEDENLANREYLDLALAIVENAQKPLQASTTSFSAIETLAHIATYTYGYHAKVVLLRTRARLMARELGVHRMDAVDSREERMLKGENFVESEVQRRAWWSMVASDWLSGFSGGLLDGSYTFIPSQMRVNLPSNIDDVDISPNEIRPQPETALTAMTVLLYRLKLADLCRQIVDSMPEMFLDAHYPGYDAVLEADRMMRKFIDDFPDFMQLDSAANKQVDSNRPDIPIPMLRLTLHFSVHSRICRLHRPYHLEGSINPKYAPSRTSCIRSAQKVLELRRAMDAVKGPTVLRPSLSWTVMQHASLAAITLAADVSFYPNDPDSDARKAQVMAAYKTLQKSEKESGALIEGIQKNLRTIMSTLQKPSPGNIQTPTGSSITGADTIAASTVSGPIPNVNPAAGQQGMVGGGGVGAAGLPGQMLPFASTESYGSGLAGDEPMGMDNGWDQLWFNFLDVAPELNSTHWNTFWGEMDTS